MLPGDKPQIKAQKLHNNALVTALVEIVQEQGNASSSIVTTHKSTVSAQRESSFVLGKDSKLTACLTSAPHISDSLFPCTEGANASVRYGNADCCSPHRMIMDVMIADTFEQPVGLATAEHHAFLWNMSCLVTCRSCADQMLLFVRCICFV